MMAQYRESLVVLNNNDTIRGEPRLTIGGFGGISEVRVKGYDGKTYHFAPADVLLVKRQQTESVVIERQSRSGKASFVSREVFEKGVISLVGEERRNTEDGNAFQLEHVMVGINQKYFPVNTRNMTEIIWPELMACKGFAAIHGDYNDRKVRRLAQSYQYFLLRSMIKKYNQLCTE